MRILPVGLAVLASCSSPELPPVPAWQAAIPAAAKIGPVGFSQGGSAVALRTQRLGPEHYAVDLLTCAHVIEDGVAGWIGELNLDVILMSLEVVAIHPTEDAAIVRAHTIGNPLRVVPVRRTEALAGERVWSIGFPACRPRAIVDGWIGQRGKASAQAFPGQSGSMVVDSRGRLVGIVKAIGTQVGPFNIPVYVTHAMMFVPIVDLLPWLDTHLP